MKILSLFNQALWASIRYSPQNLLLVGNPTRVRIKSWLEIIPGFGGISTHGRISYQGRVLDMTLVVFPTAWVDFLPDTLVSPDRMASLRGSVKKNWLRKKNLENCALFTNPPRTNNGKKIKKMSVNLVGWTYNTSFTWRGNTVRSVQTHWSGAWQPAQRRERH